MSSSPPSRLSRRTALGGLLAAASVPALTSCGNGIASTGSDDMYGNLTPQASYASSTGRGKVPTDVHQHIWPPRVHRAAARPHRPATPRRLDAPPPRRTAV